MSIKGPAFISLAWLDAIMMGLIMPCFLVQLSTLGGPFLNLDDNGRFLGFFLGFIIVFFPPGALFLTFLGWFSDQRNRLFLLWIGFGSTALCILCLLLKANWTPLFFLLSIVLFTFRASGIATIRALISDHYSEKKRAKYFGLYTVSYSLMTLIFGVTSYGIDHLLDPAPTVKLFNLIALGLVLFAFLIIALLQYQTKKQNIHHDKPIKINRHTFTDFLMDISRLMGNNRLLVLLIVFFLAQFAYGICEQYRDAYFLHNYVYESIEKAAHHLRNAFDGMTHYNVGSISVIRINFFGPLLSIFVLLFIYIPLSQFMRMDRLLLVAATLCFAASLFACIGNLAILRALVFIVTQGLLPAFILPALLTLIASAGRPGLQGTLMGMVEVIWRLGWILAELVAENFHFQYSLFPIAIAIIVVGIQWVILMRFLQWKNPEKFYTQTT